jgi:hypothetical protein
LRLKASAAVVDVDSNGSAPHLGSPEGDPRFTRSIGVFDGVGDDLRDEHQEDLAAAIG